MAKSKEQLVKKVVSLFLAIIMIASIIPATVFAENEEATDGYTFAIYDGENSVDKATVLYSIFVDNEPFASSEIQTDEGKAIIPEISEIEEAVLTEKEVRIDYKIEKDGYFEKEGSVVISELNEIVNISLDKIPPERKTVSITKTGVGDIEINGEKTSSITVEKGEKATIKFSCADSSYIKEVIIDNESQKITDKNVFEKVLTVNEDIKISVVFIKTYKVTVSTNGGGFVTVNEESFSEKTFDEKTIINIHAEANNGYQLLSINVSGKNYFKFDDNKFNKTITLSKDTKISVRFVKVYEVKISYDKDKGVIKTTPSYGGDAMIIRSGTKFNFTVTPADTYRVSKVSISGFEDEIFDDNQYNKSNPYKKSFEIDNDYNIEVSFLPLTYKISLDEAENGKSSLDFSEVEYDGSAMVTIIPDFGYVIDTITVNGIDMSSEVTLADEDVYELVLNEIKEDKKVEIKYKKAETASLESLDWNYEDALRYIESADKYVFKPGTDVVFSTEFLSIKVFYDDDTTDGGYVDSEFINSVTADPEKTIKKIEIRESIIEKIIIEETIKIVYDEAEPEVKITPAQANQYEYYNSDVMVDFSVKDSDDYSGLDKVEYRILCDGEETYKETLFEYSDKDSIEPTFDKKITVDSIINNSDDVKVFLSVTDRAGNLKEESVSLKINSTRPVISTVSIDGTLADDAKEGYYNASRTATVVIEDRESCFDESLATNGITIKAKDASGKEVIINKAAMVDWSSTENTHIGVISFDKDAQYEWEIKYTNKADLTNDGIENEIGDSIYSFTVDKKSPYAQIKVEERVWDTLLTTLSFGMWKNYTIKAVAEGFDETSDVQPVLYYKTSEDTIFTEEELKSLEFQNEEYEVSGNEAFVVYAKVVDYAGNVRYVSTNGIIVDTTKSIINLSPDKPNDFGFYNKNVNIDINVDDSPATGNDYSGIKTVSYEVVVNKGKADEKTTQSEILYDFSFSPDNDDPDLGKFTVKDWDSVNQKNTKAIVKEKTAIKKSDLKKEWNGTIVIDAKKNNYDDVRVTVKVLDNAGNEYEEEYRLSINSTKPEVSISFDNNTAKTISNEFDGKERGYFNNSRVATITIKDRASTFYEENALNGIKYSAVYYNKKDIDEFPNTHIGEWANKGDVHKIEIVFEDDGNYDFSFSYQNKADLEPEKIDTSKSTTPYFFTVDKNNPNVGNVAIKENIWSELANVLFFIFDNVKVDVTATAEDIISPTVIEYYKTSDTTLLDKEALDKKAFNKFEGSDIQKNGISPNERFVLYLKISDYAGNYYYINTDGHIIDDVASDITIKPEKGNGFYGTADNSKGQYGLYNHDVKVDINVKDADPYSGINFIEVWTEMGGKVTQPKQTLFKYENEKSKYKDLVQEWNDSYTVISKVNNGCGVVVYVRTIDNAGNENIESANVDIDITAPEITIKYDNNKDNNGNSYFMDTRTATVTIKERTHHFDAAEATKAIIITAVDVNGASVNNAYTLSSWSTKEGATPDEAMHTATIKFEKDANYELKIGNDSNTGFVDKADNANKTPDVTGQTAPYKFTVDTTAPEGTITAKSQEGREETWSNIIESLTFGFWSNKQISVTGTWKDATSPVSSVDYYMPTAKNATDETTALKKSDLDSITSWKSFDKLDVTANNQFTVYLRITDKAGNYTYMSTNGLIVDDQHPTVGATAPEISVKPEKSTDGIYKDDVKIKIKVVDPLEGGTYSGLNKVEYKVYNRYGNSPSVPTQEGQLYLFKNENPKQSDLLETWEGEITVDCSKNNSNDVQIVVCATDNAGNYIDNSDKESESYTSIKVDITDPIIDISYNNNSADSGSYFKAVRTATIKVTERNFDPDDVKITIKNTDKVIPSVVGWKDTQGKSNNDNATHTATITYSADGDYTFDISYVDMAGNSCKKVNYAAGTVAGKSFTIDKTNPKITVSYNNNSVSNGKYFKENRVATVTVTEHNFDLSRVKFTQTASINGSKIAIPSATWSTNGNNHIATIPYSSDGDYTFDVSVKDKAGNSNGQVDYGNSQAAKDFTVDKKIEKPHITGIENGKAYKDDVFPGVSFNDANFDSYKIKLTRTRLNEIDKDVTSKLITSVGTSGHGGSAVFNTLEKNPENDGIYKLYIQYTDKAGNSENEMYTFTVNRFGSVYVYDDYLISLIKDGGQYITSDNRPAITEDLIIKEYNPDKIKANSLKIMITRDGQTIKPKYITNPRKITSNVFAGESGWYEYLYTISKDNFAKDGSYKITILSEDATGNSSTSVADNTSDEEGNRVVDSISFTVDTTAPQIRNITNLDKPIVNAQSLSVKYTVIDLGGLKSIEVYFGKEKQIITSFDDIYNYSGEFVLNESNDVQKIRIIVTDLAGNVTDTESETFNSESLFRFNDSITVSTNALVRWYANKLLFFGSIGGTSALIAGSIFFIIFFKRKKEDEED